MSPLDFTYVAFYPLKLSTVTVKPCFDFIALTMNRKNKKWIKFNGGIGKKWCIKQGRYFHLLEYLFFIFLKKLWLLCSIAFSLTIPSLLKLLLHDSWEGLLKFLKKVYGFLPKVITFLWNHSKKELVTWTLCITWREMYNLLFCFLRIVRLNLFGLSPFVTYFWLGKIFTIFWHVT